MPTITVQNHAQGGSGTATGNVDGFITTSYRCHYKVTVSDDILSPSYVLGHFQLTADLPWPGRVFNYAGGFDPTSICKSVDANWTEKSAGQFIVTANYEPAQGNFQQEEQPDNTGRNTTNPLLWADEVDVSYSSISIPVEAAEFRGFAPSPLVNRHMPIGSFRPITNSALKPYDPSIEEEAQIKIIRITKHSAFSQVEQFNKYIGAINSDTVTINKPAYGIRDTFGPFRAYIKGLSGTFAITNGIRHWRQTIEVHVSPLIFGWLRPIVDRGLDARRGQGDPDGRGGVVSEADLTTAGVIGHEPIKDKEGVPITEPVLLDGDGQPRKPGENAVYLLYNVRAVQPFSSIRW